MSLSRKREGAPESRPEQNPGATTGTKKRRASGPPKIATLDGEFFQPTDWTIFCQAHEMVEKLVFPVGDATVPSATMGHPHRGTAAHHHDGGEVRVSPYRLKLIDLANWSITNKNKQLEELEEKHLTITPEELVAQAWGSVEYFWYKASEDKTPENEHFPAIGISESFRDNDYRTGQTSNQPTTMDRKTLLFFFRKIKRQFLHVVHRFLEIRHEQTLSATLTPKKYTPFAQKNRNKPEPEVGDHDEEEDSGGPIVPLHPNKKLSDTNPLCLYFDKQFLKLDDAQVEGLLDLGLYLKHVTREGLAHHNGRWSVFSCRAVISGVLTEDFYEVSAPSSSVRGNSGSRSRSSSPGTPTFNDFEAAPVALWRTLGQNAIVLHPTSNTVSRSDSPVEGLPPGL